MKHILYKNQPTMDQGSKSKIKFLWENTRETQQHIGIEKDFLDKSLEVQQ